MAAGSASHGNNSAMIHSVSVIRDHILRYRSLARGVMTALVYSSVLWEDDLGVRDRSYLRLDSKGRIG